MKRKIAAIFAADVVGYSKLVAEDEEETLRRLQSYRAVMDDFIARAGGRIFNTAGDAVLAEFSSSVEAVRCAIDIQESLRTRNMAYPTSRQMSFRIGITVGDVVERDGDLLGDGVNIAARLEGIAPVGGICISRTVHEQVANKLSVHFADIGEQHVKNIPTPVHAYKMEMRPDEALGGAPVKQPVKTGTRMTPAVVTAACLAVLAIAAIAYLTFAGWKRPQVGNQANLPPAAHATSATTPAPVGTSISAARSAETLVPETIPFVPDRARVAVRNEYVPAADHKALAISTGPIGFSTGQADDVSAKSMAQDICQKRADMLPQPRKCELYAVGNTVVYDQGHPPMPPAPWVRHDLSIARPLVVNEIPLIHDVGKTNVEKNYVPARGPKALALGPFSGFSFLVSQESSEEAIRRVLELCGKNAGVPCLVVAVDNDFVVPIPMTMKVVGFFRPAGTNIIAPELRDDLARRLGNGVGWSAVATGNSGTVGLTLNAASEQAAIAGAMSDCAKQDRSCRIVAIGPFAVEPK